MKFEIKTGLIKDYLKRLSISVQSVSSRIEFTGVLINVWENSITFEGRNDYMDTKIEESSLSGVKIIETGKALIKANILNEIIQNMTGNTVIFSKIDSNVLVVEDEHSNYKINLLTEENYERTIINPELDETVIIDSKTFYDSVSKTSFAGNEYHTNFIYQGLNLLINNGYITTTVCDGIRIASYKSSINSDINISKIIPLKVVKELIKTLPSSGEYKFSFSHNKGVVIAGNMINQFSLIEGTFPVFDKYLNPDIYNKKLIIKNSIFNSGIERAVILSSNKNDSSNRIGINISNKILSIESREQEIGSSKIEIEKFLYEGEDIEISISSKILHDGLKHSESEEMELLLTEPKSSILLKSKNNNFVYLMSPMV